MCVVLCEPIWILDSLQISPWLIWQVGATSIGSSPGQTSESLLIGRLASIQLLTFGWFLKIVRVVGGFKVLDHQRRG